MIIEDPISFFFYLPLCIMQISLGAWRAADSGAEEAARGLMHGQVYHALVAREVAAV
jgi:hypothetical protein